MSAKTQALLFDLGNVIFAIDFDRAFAVWESISELTFDEIKRTFHFDEPYGRHERGLISADEYFEHLRRVLKLRPDRERILEGWNAIYLEPIRETLQMVEAARRHLPCYAFTNTNAVHQAEWHRLYAGSLDDFDHIFTSHEIGHRKPDVAAFHYVTKAIGVPAASILFFDDSLENVDGAKRAGLAAILVRSPADVRHALRTVLGDFG